jgi:hypothetical protein
MTHYLNREQMRVVKTNDKGRVVKRKRYSFGDEVDVSLLDEDRVEALTEKGTLVTSKDDLDKHAGYRNAVGTASQRRGQATTVAGAVGAAGAKSPEDVGAAPEDAESTTLDPEPTHEGEPQGEATEKDDDENDGELVDEYSAMDYSELQEAAKDKGLKYVGVSADDLRTNLRES